MKRVLVDINHPAHVHLFRHFIHEMKTRGYEVIVTAKRVPSITSLLRNYKIAYIDIGPKKDGMLQKYIYEFVHVLRLVWLVLRQRVDVGIGVSMALPIVSKLTRMKAFALDDDDLTVTPIFGSFISVADVILTPSSLAFEDRGPNRIVHDSFHELAYLHPNRFRPDPGVLNEVGLAPGEPFFIMRFNAFKAHHDTGAQGLTLEQKKQLIGLLLPYGRLFITTEREIEPELRAYQLPIAPEKIHSLMYYATLFVGDSQTMVSEAALLGTPSIKLNSFAGHLSVPNEIEERYGLCYAFLPSDFTGMIHKIQELLATPDLKVEWQKRKDNMLADKIDLTSFLIELVSGYTAGVHEVNYKQTPYSTPSC
jgi:hypothetical protein